VIDLCYERLIYDHTAHNLPKVLMNHLRDRTVLACSASKAYAMTGWRCGWTLGPARLIAACNAIQSHSTSNVCSISQKAAIAALNGPQTSVTAMLDEYRTRRDKLCEWLTVDSRFHCRKPAGAFYMFPEISGVLTATGLRSSAEFAQALLDEARVALIAGEAFDAPGFIRISYATSLDCLREGITRLLEFVRSRERRSSVAV
jgi:aspartate aminotransferase